MLTGGYQLLDLTGITFVNHETYLSAEGEEAVEKAKELRKALNKAYGRKPFVVGGTINIATTETVDDEEVTTIETRDLLSVVPTLAETGDEEAIVVLPEGYVLEEANYLLLAAGIVITSSLL